jgi:7-keto-8-aminopelargonate synthetase-like enzyme
MWETRCGRFSRSNKLLKSLLKLRERLSVLSSYACMLLKKELGAFPPNVVRVPIPDNNFRPFVIPIVTPYAVPLAMRLRAQGWSATPIGYPAVPRGQMRLRFTIHAANTEQEIAEFVMYLRRIIGDEGWRQQHVPSGTIVDDVGLETVTARL